MAIKKRSKQKTIRNKAWKSVNEAKFEKMVSDYHMAKEILDTMVEGTDEFTKQKEHCDSLFSSAERFFNQNQ